MIDTVATMRTATAEVPADLAGALLGPVPAVFHGGVNDVLLAGLAVAVAAWRSRRGQPSASVLVDVEGHGREPGDAGTEVDLSRTVGWFTSIYPVRLDSGPDRLAEVTAGGPAAGDAVKRVKEQLRAVPGDGLGFGLLRYLNAATGPVLAALPVPQIGFNYLGRFSTGRAGAEPGREQWRLAEDGGLGGDTDEGMPAAHVLEAVAMVADQPGGPELTVRLSWPGGLLDAGEVGQLAEDWVAALGGIVAHARRPGAGGFTPSDFPLVALGQEQVAELEAEVAGLAEVWPLAPLQEGLLFHALYDRQGPDVYTVQHVFGLEGPLDVGVLRASAQALLVRHANLRVCFRQPAGSAGPVQVVPDSVVLPWRVEDLSGLGASRAAARAEGLAAQERDRRFDLGAAPLLRFALVRLGPARHQLVLTSHHILADGWSVPVLARELFAVYAAGGDVSVLAPVTPYREFLAWLAGQDREAARAAWAAELAGLDEPTLLVPAETGRVSVAPGQVTAELGDELAGALAGWARSAGVTLNTVVQGAWGLLVGRLSGRDDVVFGVTVAGRPPELPGVESMLGLFINTIPARVRLDPGEPVAELLAGLQDRQSALFAHQYLGLAEIQRAAGPGAVFDTLMVYENYPVVLEGEEAGDLRVTGGGGRDATHYPLSLIVVPHDGLRLVLGHRPDLFDAVTARSIAGRLVRVLGQVAADPNVRVSQVEVVDAAERRRLTQEWNDTAAVVPDLTLAGLFGAQVARSPDAVAVVCGGEALSYREVGARAGRLAGYLAGLGAGPESVVAVVLERSALMVAAVLGVVRAGAAYLPVDPGFPAARIAFMLADAAPVCVVTAAAAAGGLPEDGLPRVVLDDPATGAAVAACPPAVAGAASVGVRGGHPAYVMFTSGSTGGPKGVVVPQAGVVNRLWWMQEEYGLGAGERVLHKTPLGFDVSVWELFWPLVTGGCLVVARAGGTGMRGISRG